MLSWFYVPPAAAAAVSCKLFFASIHHPKQWHLLGMRTCTPAEHSVPHGLMTCIDWTHYPLWNKLIESAGQKPKQGALAASRPQLVAASTQNDITS
jgi:hypothetical protein